MKSLSRKLFIGFFIIPVIIYFLVLFYWPFVQNVKLMFYKYDYFSMPQWVGLDNIQTFFEDKDAWRALINTFIITIVSVPVVIMISMFIAIILNNLKSFVVGFRSMIFATHLTSIIIAGIIFRLWFNTELGFINGFLINLGFDKKPWLIETSYAMLTIIIVSVWKYVGYFMVVFLAGLSTINRNLYEAAVVDGANTWKQFFCITLPSLKPTIFFTSIIATINYLRSYALVEVLTAGGPYGTTKTILMLMFEKGFYSRKVGYASVLAFLLFAIILTISLIQIKVTNYNKEDGEW